MDAEPDRVLIVDDNEVNRDLLAKRLQRQGYGVTVASNGFEALELMGSMSLDLVLLDIMMPQMNGYQVLETLKADPALRHIPVVMISAVNDIDSIVRCIELGAEDYLSKPFNPVLLKARINACLEKKRLRDQEQAYLKKLAEEQEKSERLLLNILPEAIAQRLKRGESTIADSFADVTVLFADIVNFTKLSANLSPAQLVEILNEIFSAFDELAEKYELEKIKTIGDAYMVVGGLPTPRDDHAEAIANMALDMQNIIGQFHLQGNEPVQMRTGINTGAVEAGVIGTKKFTYDLWGDTVNTANRMESHGIAGKIQVTVATYERLKDKYIFEERGLIDIKGKGEMLTYFLTARKY
ncbi:Adenylate cyclase [Planktothrix tepida]|uniref:Adenylate cyclase n=2 Tax=Planktothrix TaxID=54304 RepID=A0A1J1LTS6_9CYAN|nr:MULTISPECIES: adenylate/guanylate cyclase domain-containing protein [Planktothrix]MBD2481319.1 response regulator [Planktothrix sp. FACHB-1365]CAD5941667.1 Adenylate cyclase [Planktothrix pseudagardhii]CAD5969185.1 Adenylate cyclase [Planktothrix tepida]CUR35244.1 Two-component hybrid sensor and regulator [Planktothrix tepida PCC 9214]